MSQVESVLRVTDPKRHASTGMSAIVVDAVEIIVRLGFLEDRRIDFDVATDPISQDERDRRQRLLEKRSRAAGRSVERGLRGQADR